MPRLPIVGSDDGTWGDILNEFLEVSLDNSSDPTGGTLKSSAVDDAGAVMNTDSSTAAMQFVVDEDDMSSDSATKVPTQQSVKAYVDSEVGDVSTELDNTVKLTGNQTVGGIKTFTSQLRGEYGADGKAVLGGLTGAGGVFSLYNDTSDDDANPAVGISATVGIVFGDGSSAPDTGISRAGASNLSFNTARLSNVADPTDAQDAATKHYIDQETARSKRSGSVGYRTKNLDGWFTALDQAYTTPVDVVVIGDSIASANFGPGGAWPWQLAKLLSVDGGTRSHPSMHFVFAKTINFVPAMNSCDGTATQTGIGGWSSSMTNGQTGSHTANIDGVTVVYTRHTNGGQIEVRDGGPSGTLLTTIDTAGSQKGSQMWTSNALTFGSHQIHITAVCDPGETVLLEGLYLHFGTRARGVRVWPASHAGYTSAQFTTQADLALDLIENIQPKLVIIATGTNDGSEATPSQYDTAIRNLVAAIQTKTSNDIALWIPYINTQFGRSEAAVGRQITEDLGLGLIDGSVGLGDWSANGDPDNLYSYDNVHPGDRGNVLIANHVYSSIGGDPLGSISYAVGALKAFIQSPTQTWQQAAGKVEIGTILGSPTFSVYDGSANPSISLVNHTIGAAFGSGGASISLGNGTSLADVYMNRAGPARMAINQSQGTLAANLSPNINLQTGTSYTLVLTDAGKQIIRSNSGASTQTLPQNSDVAIPVGTIIPIINGNTGVVTFQAGTGATIGGDTTLASQQRGTMTKVDTNIWFISTGGSSGTVTLTGTETLTNKRITPRVGTVTSSATPTINTDNVDYFEITAQAADITSMTTNLSGTPTNGQKLWISITGTASRAITWGASFEASTVALPTTTSGTTRLDVGFIWNSATSKWRCVGAV